MATGDHVSVDGEACLAGGDVSTHPAVDPRSRHVGDFQPEVRRRCPRVEYRRQRGAPPHDVEVEPAGGAGAVGVARRRRLLVGERVRAADQEGESHPGAKHAARQPEGRTVFKDGLAQERADDRRVQPEDPRHAGMRADEGVADLRPAQRPHGRVGEVLSILQGRDGREVDVGEAAREARLREPSPLGVGIDGGGADREHERVPTRIGDRNDVRGAARPLQ
ncbi:hypothetical protein [Methylobacterium sp. SD21]|uniref:hypothetical protein n=1 Tax=Methylobacterium litchii TaxID=3138810 RepID=UPI00313A831D